MNCRRIGCRRRAQYRQLCPTHYGNLYHRGGPRPPKPLPERPARHRRPTSAERAEDALWLLSWGESVHEVARRLGITVAALEALLRRNGAYDRTVACEAARERAAA